MPKKVNSKKESFVTNKVYEVILSMDKSDRKRFHKFLESPFFSSSETLLSLYQILCNVADENGKEGFNKQSVWKTLFKSNDFNDVNFRKYCSDLFRLVEKYLAVPLDEDEEYYRLLHFAENVKEKKIEPLNKTAISGFDTFLENQTYLNSRYYYFKFKKSNLEYEILEKQQAYKTKVNFEEISDSLDVFYLLEKLKLMCNVFAHKRLINVDYKVTFSEELSKLIANIELDKHPGLSLFYHTYLLMKDPENIENFFLLKENLLNNWRFLSDIEVFDVIVSAMNFCTNRINKGEKSFYKEYFELIRFGIDKNLFVINGIIEVWRFNNFFYAALQIDEVEWAEKFILNYKQYLPNDQRESTVSFNLARLYRKKGEIHKVLDVLKNVEYADLGYNVNSKAMLIMAYFDLDEFDTLDSVIDSFKVYLNRHKDLSTQKRKLYLNFLKYTRRLMRLVPGDKKVIEKFKDDLQKEKSTTVNFDWLNEKIAEIE